MTVRRSFFWAAIGQALVFLINFGGAVAVARILNPLEFGTYIIGAALFGVCSAATAFNIGAYVIGEKDLPQELLDSAFTLNATICMALAVLMVVLSKFSLQILGSSNAGLVMQVLALQPLVNVAIFRPLTMLNREMRFREIAIVNVAAALSGTTVSVVTALQGQGFLSQAWGTLAIAGTTLLGMVVFGTRHMSFRVGVADWAKLTAFGARMTTISGAALATARLSEIIIGRMLGLHALGIFSRASGLSNQLWDNVYGTATRVAFAQLSKSYREDGELGKPFLHSLSLIAGVMCPMLAGMAVLSPYIVHLLYGDVWVAASLPFSIMLIAQIIAIGFGMNWELFVIRRETGRQTKIELLRNVVSLSAVSFGALFSVGAAALGRLIDNCVGLLLYKPHVLRLSGIPAPQLHRVFLETLILMLAAAAPSFALMASYRWSSNVPHSAVAVAILTGVTLWLFALFKIKHSLSNEAAFLFRKVQERFSNYGDRQND